MGFDTVNPHRLTWLAGSMTYATEARTAQQGLALVHISTQHNCLSRDTLGG